MEDRGAGHLGAPGGLGFGGAFGDPLALDRHVDQPAKRLGDPLEILMGPRGVARHVQPRGAGTRAKRHRRLVAGGRRHRLERHPRPARSGGPRDAGADAVELSIETRARQDRRRDLSPRAEGEGAACEGDGERAGTIDHNLAGAGRDERRRRGGFG